MPYKDKAKNDACKKAWRQANPKQMIACRRASEIKKAYGISAAEYDAKLARQNNLCALCLKPFDVTHNLSRPVLDHDHRTGKSRGFLHNSCNLGIGFLQDNPAFCSLAVTYLERFSQEEP